jgi:hypothetical protein
MSGSTSPFPRRPEPRAPLPDYDHPPLVQVSLSVMFDEGPLAAETRLQAFERELGPTWRADRRSQHSLGEWQTRLGDQRVIVDPGQLDYVWDGRAGDLYPHYPLVREGFVGVWNAWCAGATSAPRVVEWSLQYLNRIPQGTVWTSLADCSFCRWLSPLPSLDGLPAPTRLNAAWEFPLESFQALLSVALRSGATDPAEPPGELWLSLGCTGAMENSEDTFLAGLDYGREAIVRTFRQLMTPAANAYWGLKG